MSKKVYLLTDTSFSCVNGMDVAHAVNFDRNFEVSAFSSRLKASRRLAAKIEVAEEGGWYRVEENSDIIAFRHPSFAWRRVIKIVAKELN